jgi:hypothetical protein
MKRVLDPIEIHPLSGQFLEDGLRHQRTTRPQQVLNTPYDVRAPSPTGLQLVLGIRQRRYPWQGPGRSTTCERDRAPKNPRLPHHRRYELLKWFSFPGERRYDLFALTRELINSGLRQSYSFDQPLMISFGSSQFLLHLLKEQLHALDKDVFVRHREL